MYQAFLDFSAQGENYWKINVFLIVLGTAAASFVASLVLRHLQKQLKRTETVWDDAALNAASSPLRALIWVLGINIACHQIARHSSTELFGYASTVREVVVIFIMAWFLTRFVRNVEQELMSPPPGKPPVDVTSAQAISKLVRISIGITAFLILLEKLGYSVAGVMAFGGIGGIAVGFAAKDLLANFFGGLMIFLDRPFSIGDWVRSPDREIEGTVEHIGWRQTRIRTLEKRPLYVPNSMFASIAVENPSRMTHRRIRETLGLRYEDWEKIGAITEKVRSMLESSEHIDQSQGINVSFTLCNASSLDFLVNAFTRVIDGNEFARVKQEILLRIMEIVREEGADFAFPTQTLHVTGNDSGIPALEAAR
ncbi:MAG: mechanosensitive ion channel family protein [Moraxellaceae bacterium]